MPHEALMTDFLHDGQNEAPARILLAHGAGAAMDSPFMTLFAGLLAERDLAVTRFEFAYMAARRTGGKKRPPPRADTLTGAYRDVVTELRGSMPAGQRLVIGGKSMGGRVASMIAGDLHANGSVTGLVCLGYPFHPPARPEDLRTAHLAELTCPALIVQGERDPFGPRAEVEALFDTGAMSTAIRMHWASDGDHDLGPRGGQGFTRKGNLTAAADAVATFALAPR